MLPLASRDLTHLLTTYGYLAVLLFVAIESTGIPFPGETMLLVAAIYAGTTHHLAIPGVIVSAAAGAILGDNLGFFIGREGGSRLVRRYGPLISLDERKLKLGIYLFRQHGGKVVFFGRFVAVLRAWAASLAGTNRMPWERFLAFNAAGGILWATLFGLGGYLLGDNVHRFTGTLGRVTLGVAVIVLIASLILLRRHETRLEEEAERALPDRSTSTRAEPDRPSALPLMRPAGEVSSRAGPRPLRHPNRADGCGGGVACPTQEAAACCAWTPWLDIWY